MNSLWFHVDTLAELGPAYRAALLDPRTRDTAQADFFYALSFFQITESEVFGFVQRIRGVPATEPARADIVRRFSKRSFARIQEHDGPFTPGDAVREMFPVKIADVALPIPFGSVVFSVALSTRKEGQDHQFAHCDIAAALAKQYDLWNLFSNLGEEECTLLVGDAPHLVQPGDSLLFPSHVMHRGSKYAHTARLVVLFSTQTLAPAVLKRLQREAKYLEKLGSRTPPAYPVFP